MSELDFKKKKTFLSRSTRACLFGAGVARLGLGSGTCTRPALVTLLMEEINGYRSTGRTYVVA